MEMNLRLQKIVTPPCHFQDAKRYAEQDWDSDRQGQPFLDFEGFFDSMFQMLSAWTEAPTQSKYVALLDRILQVRYPLAYCRGVANLSLFRILECHHCGPAWQRTSSRLPRAARNDH